MQELKTECTTTNVELVLLEAEPNPKNLGKGDDFHHFDLSIKDSTATGVRVDLLYRIHRTHNGFTQLNMTLSCSFDVMDGTSGINKSFITVFTALNLQRLTIEYANAILRRKELPYQIIAPNEDVLIESLARYTNASDN